MKREQPSLEFMQDSSYKFSPQTKEDWDRIVTEVESGSYKKEEGAYAVRRRGGGYEIGQWQKIGSDPNLRFVRPGNEDQVYQLSGLKKPRPEQYAEIEDDLPNDLPSPRWSRRPSPSSSAHRQP